MDPWIYIEVWGSNSKRCSCNRLDRICPQGCGPNKGYMVRKWFDHAAGKAVNSDQVTYVQSQQAL
jgi:hypothetical protein